MTLSTLPFIIAAILSYSLAYYIWRYRFDRGMAVRFLMYMMLAAGTWAGTNFLQVNLFSLPESITLAKVRFISIALLPVFLMLFSVYYSNFDRYLTPSRMRAVFIVPALTILISMTNEVHGFFWTSTSLTVDDGLAVFSSNVGFWFWVHTAYSYVVLMVGVILLIRQVIKTNAVHRLQAIPMVIAVLVPWVANILYFMEVLPFDYTPTMLVVTGIAIHVSVFGLKAIDMRPVARGYVLDMMDDIVLVLDNDDRVIDLNNMALEQLVRQGAKPIGQPVSQLIGKQYADLLAEYHGSKQLQTEIEVNDPVAPRYYDVKLSQVADTSGAVMGRVIVLRNITERRIKEAQIEEANKELVTKNTELAIAREQAEEAVRLKSSFLATMSHELRTPLNAIIGYSEIIMMGMTGEINDEQQDYQNRILKNGEHLLQLINEILDLSKIEAGRLEILSEPIHVAAWMNEVIYQVKGLAEEKGLAINQAIVDELPEQLLGDAPRLKQISINLLSNAIKFTENGTVDYEARYANPEEWQIIVRDTGIGIAPHMQEVIFQEFRQVDDTTSRKHEGTGLGLAIVRKLVIAMKGTIRVSSKVGEGSIFVVTLPLKSIPTSEPQSAMLEETITP